MTEPALPLGDYISPNLVRVLPDAAFPHMIIGTPATTTWPHLRRQITHNWYVDRRAPTVGFVSRDEASILYNTALMFEGLPSLEIGCWRGWSTVHIALGTHSLDAIDPILTDSATREELVETLRRAGVHDRVSLVPLASPEGVERVAAETGKRWSFAFIDGDHSGDAPLTDAAVVQRFAASDALIILHDLAAPEPAAALAYLRDQGWTTAIYQTMQIMGVATRGRCRPVAHIPDPSQQWSLPEHLSSFTVIGEKAGDTARRIIMALGCPDRPTADLETERDDARERADIEQALLTALRTGRDLRETRHLLDDARSALVSTKAFDDLQTHYLGLVDTLTTQRNAHETELEALNRNQAQALAAVVSTKTFDDLHARYVTLVDTLAGQRIARDALAVELAEAGRALESALALRDEALAARDKVVTESQRIQADHARLTNLLDRSMRSLAAVERRVGATQTESQEVAKIRSKLRLRSKQLEQRSRDLLELRATVDAHVSREAAWRAADTFARAICLPRVLLGLARRAMLGAGDEVRRILADAFIKSGSPTALPAPVVQWLSRPRTLLGLLRRRVFAGGSAVEGLLAKATRAHIRLDSSAMLSPQLAVAELRKTLADAKGRVKKANARVATEQRLVQETEHKAQELARKFKAVESALVAEERALNEAQLELAGLRAAQRTTASDRPLEVTR